MKVLFDQNVPRNLRQHLAGHTVFTAANMGWDKLRNGELLEQAEKNGFDVFITGDRSLRYQQNLEHRRIAIIELTRNDWPSVRPQIRQVTLAVTSAIASQYIVIPCQKPAPA